MRSPRRAPRRAWPSAELPPLRTEKPTTRKPPHRRPVTSDSALPSRRKRAAVERGVQSAGPSDRLVLSPQHTKVYPRLRTLSQLADNYVRELHVGEFVTRSESRWQSFDGNSQSTRNSARQSAYSNLQSSAALVIQCAWRRYTAAVEKLRLLDAIWQRQLAVAAQITRHTATLVAALESTVAPAINRRLTALAQTAAASQGFLPARGLHYHLPARLLTWWLAVRCARAVGGRFVRRSPAVLHAVDLPVEQTFKTVRKLWRIVDRAAAITIQCCFRVFSSRQETARRRHKLQEREAARKLQAFVRVCNAQQMAQRLRRRCAAIRIQCMWRCRRARACVRRQRLRSVATRFCTPLLVRGARQATAIVRVASAKVIQKRYRGSRARAHFRGLLSRQQQCKWRQNPSKGLLFFTQRRYDRAALYLENCFRQGIFEGEIASVPLRLPESESEDWQTDTPSSNAKMKRKLASGSRMSFSFSAAPTKLGVDWVLPFDGRKASSSGGVSSDASRALTRLQFWQAYALSHLKLYEATGDALNLQQARVGWQSYLHVDAVVSLWTCFQGSIVSVLQDLCIRSVFSLAQCLFWGGKSEDREQALTLTLELLEDTGGPGAKVQHVGSSSAEERKAQLLMLSSMLYFQQSNYARCCAQLEELLMLSVQTSYSDVEIRFALALTLLRRFEESGSGSSDPETAALLRTATLLLKQCYQEIELWPSVGFYHGWMWPEDAKQLLTGEPAGAFLLHHTLDATSPSGKQRSQTNTAASAGKLLLQVKISTQPTRITSLRIDFADGVYRTHKLPHHAGHFSVHGFVASLPEVAAINMSLGVRRRMHVEPLRMKLLHSRSDGLTEKESRRATMLSWTDWERKLEEEHQVHCKGVEQRWRRRNETWSAVCLEVAKILECSQAWVFAELAARESLSHSKDRSRRADACFLASRVALNLNNRVDSALLMQQARLEAEHPRMSAVGTRFIDNLVAVQRAWSRNVSVSRVESFSSRLERVQKLERMCLKAWGFDSLATRLRGDAFSEAVLLQRIHDEMYAECGDTFFIRSLLRAHVRAYLSNSVWYEHLHLKRALRCVVQLFERFQTSQCSQRDQLTGLVSHFEGRDDWKRTASKAKDFNVSLLLLSWHHMPFLLCFEMAEVLYRSTSFGAGRTGSRTTTLLDVYESLHGRLRGSQVRGHAYAPYEELFLLRLAFLHASKSSHTELSWRHLDSAVATMDELLTQRRRRRRASTLGAAKKQAKTITWPSALRLPYHLSDAEVVFIRGFFREMREDLQRTPTHQRESWRDYHLLHREVLELVTQSPPRGEATGGRMLNSVRFRAENLQGLRIFVGATQDVLISNLLASHPFIAIRYEGKTHLCQTPPNWTNLSPSWEEDVEIAVASPRAHIVVSVMNRTRRTTRHEDAELVGSVVLSMQELIAARDGVTAGKYYMLERPGGGFNSRSGDARSVDTTPNAKQARLFLSFQVLVKPQRVMSLAVRRTAAWATRRGNWDVEELRTHFTGDLQAFVASRWIWSRFAGVFAEDKDLSVAKWFYLKAARLTPTLQRRSSALSVRVDTGEALAVAKDLVGLCRCFRATLGYTKWGEHAAPYLVQAEALLTRSAAQSEREYASVLNRPELEKQLSVVQTMLADARGGRGSGPLAQALATKRLASSQWIRMSSFGARDDPSDSVRYLNQDTGEIFDSNRSTEPLEYEDPGKTMVDDQQQLLRRRGVVVMNGEMRARVQLHRQELLRLHAADPFEWVAIFNDRKQEVQFFSPHLADMFPGRSSDGTSQRPETYVMLADDLLLYHVLLVQDAYRKFHRRRKRQHRIRGLFWCACWCVRELFAARRRIFLRSDAVRKRTLNCVRVVVEKAQHLLAGDLLSSDPYVTLALLSSTGDALATGKTSVRYSTLNPSWNEEFHLSYSFQDHEAQQSEEGEAVLALTVWDYDVVPGRKKNHKTDRSTAENEDSDGDESEQEDSSSDQEKLKAVETHNEHSHDFLGMVSVAIEMFMHGKCVTADLALLNEDGQDDSPRSRGTLTLSVQWTHCEDESEHVSNRAKLRAIGAGGGRHLAVVKSTKEPRPKPELTEDGTTLLDLLRVSMEQLLQLLIDMATSTLEPMQRLHRRLQEARTSGKTAEEAKVLEQRMAVMLRSQLLPKQRVMRDLAGTQISEKLAALLGMLREPIEEYAASFEESASVELRSTMETLMAELTVTTVQFQDATAIEDGDYTHAIALALAQRRHVNNWNTQLRRLLDTFVAGERATWRLPLEDNLNEVYTQLGMDVSASSDHHASSNRMRPATAGMISNSVEAGAAPAKPTTTSTVEKRKERILRDKQKKRWYQL